MRAAEIDVLFTADTKQIEQADKKIRETGQRVEKNPVELDANAKPALESMDRVEEAAKKLVSKDTLLTVDANIERGEKSLDRVQKRLDYLRSVETTMDVKADIARAEASLSKVKRNLDGLKAARATMEVDADTSEAEAAFDGVKDDAGDAGEDAGAAFGDRVIAALATIPVVGAVVGIGAAAAKALVSAFEDGLQIEVGYDRLQALTGVDEATALRLGRAAGEAYANNFGESVESNMDATRLALQFRIIDPASTTRDAQLVVQSLAGIADAVEKIGALSDPVGRQIAAFERPNGLLIERIAVPLGVIGVIFESRPNVTADAGALCLKAGNAAILRAGSDSFRSAQAIAEAMSEGLSASGLPAEAIQIVPTRDRAAVGLMLAGLDGGIDVIVPRGGRSLVERVQAEAKVPVFAHLDGICHVYVAKGADLDMARTLLLNSKLRRTGICGAAETLLVDRACASTHLAPLVTALLDAGCAVRGDADVLAVDPRVTPANEQDWRTEYLDAIISARVVDGLDAAIEHIETNGSHHTDAIVTGDAEEAARFLAEVDSAIVTHNASTQFADGGEFGFGAEIGIATGRMHARGPVGVEQLTTFKYRVHGSGQTRP